MQQPTQPERYDELLAEKAAELTQQFAEFNPPELEVFASAPEHYRMRAEFRVWHEGDDLYYVMFEKGGNRDHYRVNEFPVASKLINELMPRVIDEVKKHPVLRYKLFQVDFLTTQSGEALISLLYHKALTEEWEVLARGMRDSLGFDLVGRSRKQKFVIERDWVTETMNVNGRQLQYKQIENSFTQPNAGVAEKMLEWAIDVSRDMGGDLLELYCGNGNFSLALAQNFDRVLGTEIAKSSVYAAQYNIELNGIDNVKIGRLSSEEFSAAMLNNGQGGRRFTELGLADYQFDTVLVDPPRAGLDADSIALIQQYSNILYISCNPDTLHENLGELGKTHEVVRFALFDQFPYTHHKECGVMLKRRAG
ncbi:tRNA (uridine(54)-C5)-methyltransferase TrmA [Pokkaliibacter sp. CJK22405]|uniref:tRNA (uridine(54)-C5)-methyltransferase TrmA n=1 Tax=Pokkaliibacter sp. CJK22405 TaxID=3384615 RepID=UPI0039851558